MYAVLYGPGVTPQTGSFGSGFKPVLQPPKRRPQTSSSHSNGQANRTIGAQASTVANQSNS